MQNDYTQIILDYYYYLFGKKVEFFSCALFTVVLYKALDILATLIHLAKAAIAWEGESYLNTDWR